MATPPRPIASYYSADAESADADSIGQLGGGLAGILAYFREAARSSRDLGDRFERLMVEYLKLDPKYDFEGVWMWMDWPGREGRDNGIDVVARERLTGDYWAIQCKFFGPDKRLSKGDIDSFFTESGKEPFKHRLIIATTDKWSDNAKKALENQQIPVQRLRVEDLADAPIDWDRLHPDWLYGTGGGGDRSAVAKADGGSYQVEESGLRRKAKKELRPHQQEALEKVIAGLREVDRGKLIMACGTGKTFTSLKIAEAWVQGAGFVLFLVPSIALLSQTLQEWTAEAAGVMRCVAVCSDPKVSSRSKKGEDLEDLHPYDLPISVTTDAAEICAKVRLLSPSSEGLGAGLTVIFSTYQSLEAISEAQKQGLPVFDLIICDEAHRTTGVTTQGKGDSHFVMVHDQGVVKGKKRLYMTATPRIYKESAKTKARESEAEVFSMDDPDTYGPELHRLGFAQAVERELLTDYKVMVLAVDERYVSRTFQRLLTNTNSELEFADLQSDLIKITGCWNGLAKRMARSAETENFDGDIAPMRRAVAFCGRIDHSKQIRDLFNEMVQEYSESHPTRQVLQCRVDHVDGKQNVFERNQKLDWLKEDTTKLDTDQGTVCRILSNARCLSEGVDVPALDAVMFLSPRNSIVDVVQSVGRVMRKAPGKKYGYIILPIGIPAGMKPEKVLDSHEGYKVVWEVLQALRSHDDLFNTVISQIRLNKLEIFQIQIVCLLILLKSYIGIIQKQVYITHASYCATQVS